jgi:ribosomal protein S18 acetylase RimI-like enzyme
MSDVRVRPMEPADAPAVERVARASWHAAYDDILGEGVVERAVDDWYDLEGLGESAANEDHLFLVAVAGGELAGFAHAGPNPEDGTWYLFRIYVRPDRWGEGVGTALLDRLERELGDRGVSSYRLAVLADNEVGVSFYETRGFDRVGTDTAELAGVEAPEYHYRKEL